MALAQVYLSTRGIPLAVCTNGKPSFPFLAVELYPKWYGAYLVQGTPSCHTTTPWMPDRKAVEALEAQGEWVFADHVWNPKHLRKLIPKGVSMDGRSWELIIGRYVTLILEREFPDFQDPEFLK